MVEPFSSSLCRFPYKQKFGLTKQQISIRMPTLLGVYHISDQFGTAPDFHFVGTVDEVAVYDRVLDQNEIDAKISRGHAASVEPEGKLSTVCGRVKSQY